MTVIFSSYRYFLFHLYFASSNCCAIENIGSVRTLVNFSLQYNPPFLSFSIGWNCILCQRQYLEHVFLQGVCHFFRDWSGNKSVYVFTENRLVLVIDSEYLSALFKLIVRH